MSTQDTDNGHTVMVDPAKRQQFKAYLANMTHYMALQDQNKEAIKDIVDDAATVFSMDKKLIRRLANTLYKSNFADQQEENETFELLYEALQERQAPATLDASE
jgi:uncharacterized protein (UPF0335 family)